MALGSANSDGGVTFAAPWISPKMGSGEGTGSIPSSQLGPMPFPAGTSQSGRGGSTGMGGIFAEWPGTFEPPWTNRRGFGGGRGDRGTVR